MLREKFKDELKNAMKARNERAVATLRLIQAALKDRDIAARNDKIGKARAQLDALKATLAETARTAPEAALKEAEQQMAELQAKMKKLTAELPTLLKYKAAEEAAIKSTTGKTRINRL